MTSSVPKHIKTYKKVKENADFDNTTQEIQATNKTNRSYIYN